MPSYINFTLNPSHSDRPFAGQLPLFDGNMPGRFSRYGGVTIDKEPVQFLDETIPDRLHRALVDGSSLAGIFDCLTFACLMQDVPMGEPDSDGKFKFLEEMAEERVETNDTGVRGLVNLGSIRGGNDEISYHHTVVPAHTFEGARYLHRLGTATICLSSLEEAMRLYRCTVAVPIASIQFDGQDKVYFYEEAPQSSTPTSSLDPGSSSLHQ
jgi:hypothetical protein